VIFDHIVIGQGIKTPPVADHRVTAEIVLEKSPEKKFARCRVRIIFSHIDFPPDDIALRFEIGLREARLENQFKKNTKKGVTGCAWAIYVVDRAVKGGIGVPLSPHGIDGGREFRSREGVRALENHMLKKV